MKTVYFYMNKYERSQRAMRKFAPDADWVYTTPGDETLYPETVAAYWNKGDSLLVIEGDIVPTPILMSTMASCSADWCTAWYELGINRARMPFGYGFTKFSAKLQSEMSYDAVLDHALSGCLICAALDGGPCEACGTSCCHRHQDTAFWHEMIIRNSNPNILPHDHGKVEHLHTGTRALAWVGGGVYLWEQDEGFTYEKFQSDAYRHA